MKLSAEKRNHIILIAMITVGAVGCIWYFLISAQRAKMDATAKEIVTVRDKIDKMRKVVTAAKQLQSDLDDASKKLADIESSMAPASGDQYSWCLGVIKQFNAPAYKVVIPNIVQPAMSEMPVLPSFPYKQVIIPMSGAAYYWDLGRFIADFENRFPYARLQNLALDQAATSNPDEKEKLSFRMEVVMLVKPSTASTTP